MKKLDKHSTQVPKIIFFRHSPVKIKGTCYGQSLQETMHSHTEVAERFITAYKYWVMNQNEQYIYEQVNIWTSPAQRCLEPAKVIAAKMGYTLNCDQKLYEMSFGQWESKAWEVIEKEDYDAFHHWMNHWQVVSPPEGESLSVFHRRVGQWYEQLSYQSLNIIIGHAGVWRSLLVHHQQQTWEEAMSIAVPHLEVIEL